MSNATETVVTYQEARTYLATLEARERARTGIRTLKVGWNEAQGYFIEVTLMAIASKVSDDSAWDVPSGYIAIWSPLNMHRFVTADLRVNQAIVMAGEQ